MLCFHLNHVLSKLIGKLISLPTQHRLDSTVGEIAKEYNIAPYRTYITSVRPVYDPSGDYVLGGASYTLSGMEYDDHNYGYQKVSSFVGQKYRMLTNGVWGEWESFVLNSNLGHVDVTMNVTAGYTKISKIEGLNYIPVILRASIQYEGLSVCGSYPDNSWVAVSNTEQNITIRFFKYPV